MIRSLFTAITALTLHQKFMDVVADNIANVNTPGFKSSKVLFQDLFSQLEAAGSAPQEDVGGINPTQIGLGLKMGYVTPVFTQGTLNATGRSSDMAIQGEGFFIYKTFDGGFLYSREASLQIDSEGYLVNASTGLRLQGWNPDPVTGEVDPNWPPVDLQVTLDKGSAEATDTMVMGGNLDSTTYTDPATPAGEDYYDVTLGFYDSLGEEQTVTLRFRRENSAGDTSLTGSTPGDIMSNTWQMEVTDANYELQDDTGATLGTPVQIEFGTDGQVSSINGTAIGTITEADWPYIGRTAAAPAPTNGSDPAFFGLDLRELTQLSMRDTVTMTTRTGSPPGSVTDINVESETGVIDVVYSNGIHEKLGQLALAKFANPSGLIRKGSNLYAEGVNSGAPQRGMPKTGGRGTLNPGYLEGSNVDLGQEFTNMILAQRGFTANSRVIRAGDQMLSELTNMTRF